MKDRLPSHFFDLPVQDLRAGYLSDIYFWREKRTLEKHGVHARTTMQVFQKKEALLCGMDESLAILKVATGHYRAYDRARTLFNRFKKLSHVERASFGDSRDAYLRVVKEKMEVSLALKDLWEDGFQNLDIKVLRDGDRISPWESVMHITGDAAEFAHLETIYLGILARRTRIATDVRQAVDAANGKQVLYFPARFDHYAVQPGDGYAAHVGGAAAVSTNAQAALWGGEGMGTIPHALIAALGGDTVRTVKLFNETYPRVHLVALVDFDNDSVNTALACARAMGEELWGVRLDTAENIIDKSIVPIQDKLENPYGVVPELVAMVREALDREGFTHVKIVVSGGFDSERIARFERSGSPVDAYGVGSSLMRGEYDFTADVVLLDGKPCAKVGREYEPNTRLQAVKKEEVS